MTDKTEWLRRYAAFQGQVQQLVAQDIVEHGKPHAEREETFKDLKQRCIEMSGLAFEMYVAQCNLEKDLAVKLTKAILQRMDEDGIYMMRDVAHADRDPDA